MMEFLVDATSRNSGMVGMTLTLCFVAEKHEKGGSHGFVNRVLAVRRLVFTICFSIKENKTWLMKRW